MLLVNIPSVSHADFTTGMIVGGIFGAAISGGSESSGINENMLYVAPRIGERIADPLSIRLICTNSSLFDAGWKRGGSTWNNRGDQAGKTIQQLFDSTVDNPNQYVILQVVRVINQGNNTSAVFWFAYIEKEKVIPLDKLPPIKKSSAVKK